MDSNALKDEFLIESFENLSTINEDITHLEKDPSNHDLLNKIYRSVHTMKGSASFLGYKKLQDITHSAENLLDELREEKFVVTAGIVDALLATFDICSAILKSIEEKNDEGDFDISENKRLLDKLLENQGQTQEETTSEEVEVAQAIAEEINSAQTESEASSNNISEDDNQLSAAAMESLKELISEGKMDASAMDELNTDQNLTESDIGEQPESTAEIVKEMLEPIGDKTPQIDSDIIKAEMEKVEIPEPTQEVTPEPKPEPKVEQPAAKKVQTPASEDSKNSIADSVVRVNVKVLDKIMNIVGELVLNRNQILQYSSSQSNTELTNLSQQLNIITSELQSEVMSTRMQPIGSVLTKFERLVRDFSRQNGKKIGLKLTGQGTELDKTLIEAIKDPLVHIVRNSCDHGVETLHERELQGKAEQGTIHIKAYNESGQVTIEISDDGRGLNKERIAAKAIEKEIVTQEQISKMSDTNIFAMIFEPGFSTAEKVTNISGRGVGMDVVRTNIEKIGGSVSIFSEPNVGTTFKLRIPLTLAIVPALMVKSCDESFAIPQLNLVELVRLETEDEKKLIEKIQGSEFLKLRGKLTPVFRLNEVLNLNEVHSKSDAMNKSNLEELKASEDNTQEDVLNAENIVILNAEDKYFGIIVDEILDTEEIVVKPLNKQLKKLNIFGGAMIMGDGHVALILDALGFLNSVYDSKTSKDHSQADDREVEQTHTSTEVQENLLFKLADERVYAVPLSLVSRLEEFEVNKIEMTGNQPIIRYLDNPMPLINVEKTLKLDGQSKLDDLEGNINNLISCIVTSIAGKNYGIVVEEIRDISIDDTNIDGSAVDREGILGTIFIKDSTVSLIDLYSIINSQKLGVNTGVVRPISENVQRTKILVVDDSPVYRKMELDVLKAEGFDVTTANHGEDGILKLKENEFDLVITDIEMPYLDGYGFCQKIRAELKLENLPVIAVSTRCSESDKEKGRAAGFNYHLEKFNKDEILETVRTVIEGSK